MLNGSTKIAVGIGLGIVAAEALKDVLPAFRGLARPLLKATVKSGLILAQDSRLRVEEFRRLLADVTAEARTELEREQPAASPASPVPDPPRAAAAVM